ncbi:MAG: tetratricopeptide repeat protein [Cyanobacteria bacterium P01_A01_bin.116]
MARRLKTWYQQQKAAIAYRRGLSYAQKTDHASAIAAFSEALASGYHRAGQAYVMRGISRGHLKDTAGARADFETVIQGELSGDFTLEGLVSRESASKECASEAVTSKTSTPNRDLAKAYYHRGLLRQQSGNEAGAIADWSVAIDHCPSYPEPRYHRALLSLSQGQHRQALVDLNEVLAADPTLVHAYLQRGNLRYQLGDIPGAVADWEIAVCNDFTLEDAKQKLANVQQANYDAQLSAVLQAPLQEKGLSVEVTHTGAQLEIHTHRELGTGVNYYTLPDVIREHLVPLHLAEVSRFTLVGHLAEVTGAEWQQSYELYKGQPCPPSNWQTAFSALVLFPPFGIPAFIQAAQVKRLYQQGQYLESLSASKAVKGLCIAGSVALGFFTLLPLGYAAYDSMKETPTLRLAEKAKGSPHRPYQQMFQDDSEMN